jgi:hypothetical protein
MAAGELGQMLTPKAGNRLVDGATFALDNGIVRLVESRPVTDPDWSETRWLAMLDRYEGEPSCLFAVVPDVVGDAQATNQRWARHHGAALNRGYRACYVLQNGCHSVPVSAGAVFIGGDDGFKLGAEARALVAEARARRLWVHMGRVNSLRRLRYAHQIGCDSVDGTYLAFGPDRNLPRLRRFLRRATEPMLWEEVS